MYIPDDFDLDYDLLEDDEFHDELIKNMESPEDFLKRIGKTKKQIKKEYSEFMLWFEAVRQRFELKNMQKAVFCRSVCKALKSEYSKDLVRLWCLCLSECSSFLFEKQEDKDSEDYKDYIEDCIWECAHLLNDIDNVMRRLGNESGNRERFMFLRENISYSEETFLQIDTENFYRFVSEGVDLKGEFFKDNLMYACEKISHSKELSEIAPNVFYALLMRYRKKLTNAEGFMPNFKSATRFIKYEIGKNNGKNQDIYMEHIAVYQGMCMYFHDCDRELCDAGFACMSNLCENESFDWYEFPLLTRPLAAELRDRCFTCFLNGLDDNPVYIANDIHSRDMFTYEEFYDVLLAPKAQILCHERAYLAKCSEPAEQYIAMLEKGETDKCMKIVHDIIEKSEICPEFIKPEMSDLVNAIIMDEVLENINEKIKNEMLELIPRLQEIIGKQ